jgi:hypothetical protein
MQSVYPYTLFYKVGMQRVYPYTLFYKAACIPTRFLGKRVSRNTLKKTYYLVFTKSLKIISAARPRINRTPALVRVADSNPALVKARSGEIHPKCHNLKLIAVR